MLLEDGRNFKRPVKGEILGGFTKGTVESRVPAHDRAARLVSTSGVFSMK